MELPALQHKHQIDVLKRLEAPGKPSSNCTDFLFGGYEHKDGDRLGSFEVWSLIPEKEYNCDHTGVKNGTCTLQRSGFFDCGVGIYDMQMIAAESSSPEILRWNVYAAAADVTLKMYTVDIPRPPPQERIRVDSQVTSVINSENWQAANDVKIELQQTTAAISALPEAQLKHLVATAVAISPDRIFASDSNGSVLVTHAAFYPAATESFKAHDSECWSIECWNKTLLSGGEDAALKMWDPRQGFAAPVAVNQRTHQAGVVCIRDVHLDELRFITGSYDDHLRVWDRRNLTRPVATHNTGAAVWDCSIHPTNSDIFLTSKCHAGPTVWRLNHEMGGVLEESTMPLRSTGNLCYAVNWVNSKTKSRTAVPDQDDGGCLGQAILSEFYQKQSFVVDAGFSSYR